MLRLRPTRMELSPQDIAATDLRLRLRQPIAGTTGDACDLARGNIYGPNTCTYIRLGWCQYCSPTRELNFSKEEVQRFASQLLTRESLSDTSPTSNADIEASLLVPQADNPGSAEDDSLASRNSAQSRDLRDESFDTAPDTSPDPENRSNRSDDSACSEEEMARSCSDDSSSEGEKSPQASPPRHQFGYSGFTNTREVVSDSTFQAYVRARHYGVDGPSEDRESLPVPSEGSSALGDPDFESTPPFQFPLPRSVEIHRRRITSLPRSPLYMTHAAGSSSPERRVENGQAPSTLNSQPPRRMRYRPRTQTYSWESSENDDISAVNRARMAEAGADLLDRISRLSAILDSVNRSQDSNITLPIPVIGQRRVSSLDSASITNPEPRPDSPRPTGRFTRRSRSNRVRTRRRSPYQEALQLLNEMQDAIDRMSNHSRTPSPLSSARLQTNSPRESESRNSPAAPGIPTPTIPPRTPRRLRVYDDEREASEQPQTPADVGTRRRFRDPAFTAPERTSYLDTPRSIRARRRDANLRSDSPARDWNSDQENTSVAEDIARWLRRSREERMEMERESRNGELERTPERESRWAP